ncbi:MAG: hypothetical protein ACRDFB_05205 [Rhabdochlamydiaceae bacterium]
MASLVSNVVNAEKAVKLAIDAGNRSMAVAGRWNWNAADLRAAWDTQEAVLKAEKENKNEK